MLSVLSPFSTIAVIKPDMNDVISGFLDPFTSFRSSPFNVFYNALTDISPQSNRKNQLYTISIDLGYRYNKDDITIAIDGNKLRVTGKAIESVKNGNNTHQFEREYQIPDDVDTSTMRSEINRRILHVLFDKKHLEPKKILEDLSNDQEFRICLNFDGIKPEELSVRIVGSDLIVEGSRKSSCVSQNGHTCSSSCSYVSKTIRLHESVESDKLKAVMSENGLEIFAPKDPSRIRPKDRLLEIETQ